MSVGAAVVAGGVIGFRHALEADHIAAVATLVGDDCDASRSGLVGASWGIGHSAPIIIVGLLFVALGIRLPEAVTTLFEVVVGVVLVYLGGRMLDEISGFVSLTGHEHGTDNYHTHLSIGGFSFGRSHHHLHSSSFAVGIIHGLAGSGVLVVGMITTTPSMASAVAFLVSFGLLSILTMSCVSMVWGKALQIGAANYVRTIAGVTSIGIGVLLLVEQAGGVLPV